MIDQDSDRVAVVVFVTVDGGVDFLDRASIAEITLRRAFSPGDILQHYPLELDQVVKYRDGKPDSVLPAVSVHAIREVGIAARNGYLWVEATGHAFPREETSDGG